MESIFSGLIVPGWKKSAPDPFQLQSLQPQENPFLFRTYVAEETPFFFNRVAYEPPVPEFFEQSDCQARKAKKSKQSKKEGKEEKGRKTEM